MLLDGSFKNCYSLKTVICSDSTKEFHLSDFDCNRTLQTIKIGKNTKLIDMRGTRIEPSDSFSPVTGKMQPVIEVPDDSRYFKAVGNAVYTKDGTELVFYSPKATASSYWVLVGTKRIGAYSFTDCTAVTSVAFPDTLETIGAGAFMDCNLTSVNLPASLKIVSSNSFGTVKTVTVEGKNTVFEELAFQGNVTALCDRNSKAAKFFKKKNMKGKRIIYTLNGGVNNAGNVYYFTKTRTLKTPYREGYKFAGWYTDKACTKKITKVTKGKSYHVYAKWTKVL